MNNEERLDFVIGQVAVLKAFCAAVVISHPAPESILQVFTRASEITTAKMLPTGASEAMLEGIESMTQDLHKVLQGEAHRRASAA